MNNLSLNLGLVGFPLTHSYSPAIHNAIMKTMEVSGRYCLNPVDPKTAPQMLPVLCEQIRQGELDGLNVTIPYKTEIIKFIDLLTDQAQQIGAVNTIFCQDGGLIGDNTDPEGFKYDLQAGFGTDFLNSPGEALIFGAGGAARAVTWVLVRSGWSVTLAARRPFQADKIRRGFFAYRELITVRRLVAVDLAKNSPELIVNATPVGMAPCLDSSPWPEELPFPTDTNVYDLIYNPKETKLLFLARQNGCRTRNGLGMLVAQAIGSFERWTGLQPSWSELIQTSIKIFDHSTEESICE